MGSGASTSKGRTYHVEQQVTQDKDKKTRDKKEEKRKDDFDEIHVVTSVSPTDSSHHTQTSQWLPPKESWPAGVTENGGGAPYGWEPAVDKDSKPYFINHVDQSTHRPDPGGGDGGGGGEESELEKPEPREVELHRDTKLGFGFVAGSEKPVIVRFLTEGGPSENKLLPGDCITHINGENVEKAAREHVIQLVRACQTSIHLTVCQPVQDNSGRKSALLTAAKKARLKNNPPRVRFADAVIVNGAPSSTPSNHESYIPFMPNVLKVFLENGQTKSFKYDNKTTVKDVLDSLQEKQGLVCMQHFALVLQNMKNPTHGNMMILQPHQSLSEIAARPDSQHYKCLLRLAFVPRDAYDLAQKDPAAFEYFYLQCTNDVVQERYGTELKFEQAFRLAALHIHQHAVSTNMQKVSLKAVEREAGLDKFLPISILDATKGKEIRKLLNHFLKANSNLTAPGQKQLTALQAKMHYLKIVSDLKSFGGKGFIVTLVEQQHEAMIVVGPKYGIAAISPAKHSAMIPLVDFDQIETVTLAKEERDTMQRVILHTYDNEKPRISFIMIADDVGDFLALLEGYYSVLVSPQRQLRVHDENRNNNTDDEAPEYDGKHRVVPQSWSYPPDLTTSPDANGNHGNASNGSSGGQATTRVVDLANGPPPYLDGLQKELGQQRGQKQRDSSSLEQVQGIDLDRSSRDLGVTSELRINDAPLASPDVSTLSGSSETSIHNTESSEQIAAVIASVTDSNSDDDEDRSDATFVADSDTGSSSTTTIIDTGAVVLGVGVGDKINVDAHQQQQQQVVLEKSADDLVTESQQQQQQQQDGDDHDQSSHMTTAASSSLDDLCTLSEDSDTTTMKGEKVRAIAEKLNGKLVLGGGGGGGVSAGAGGLVDPAAGGLESRNGGSDVTGGGVSSGVVSKPLSMTPESSDTDSVNTTPSDSPAKTKLDGVVLRPPSLTRAKNSERPNSFGLHSPDNLPQCEEDFSHLAQSYGLASPGTADRGANGTATTSSSQPVDVEGGEEEAAVPSDLLHPSYNPQIFHDGGLYLDPDIIDLTLIPPPKTPEDEQLMDFSSPDNTSPPPDFGDRGSKVAAEGEAGGAVGMLSTDMLPRHIMERIDSLVQNDEELGSQLAAIDALMLEDMSHNMDAENEKESGIESESDSGNETISSENVEAPGSNMSDLAPCERSTDLVSQLAARRSYRHINFATSDIDAFIASVTVPPPPSDNHQSHETPTSRNKKDVRRKQEVRLPPPLDTKESSSLPPPPQEVRQKRDEDDVMKKLLGGNSSDILLDDEFLKYVIPAPPPSSDSVMSISDIPIVRPPSKGRSPSPTKEIRERREITSTTTNGATSTTSVVRDKTDSADKTDRKVKDTVRILEQSNQGVRRNSSSSSGGSIKRPTEAPPPPPPGSGGKLGEVIKIPRPAPPQRYSSLEPPGSVTSSAPTTPLGPEPKTSIEINVSKRQLQGVKSVTSLSADNSPLHQPLQHASSTGALKKAGAGTGSKLRAPLPPPRRSSMPGGGGGNTSPMTMESVADRIRLLQHGPKVPETEETVESEAFEKPASPIPVAKVQGKPVKVETPGSPVPGSPRTKGVSANIQARQEALRQAAKFKKEKAEEPASPKSAHSSETEQPSPPQTPTSQTPQTPQTQTPRTPTQIPQTPRTPTKASSSPVASSELIAIVPGSPKPSPLLGRSSTFSPGSSAMSSSASSSATSASSTMVPRPYHSPRASPTIHRHSSFSRSGIPERSPSPFRTFLGEGRLQGGGSGGGGSDSETTPVSPRKSGGASGGGSVFQYPGTLGRSAGLRTTPAQVKQSHSSRKSIPFQMVHPMIASSSSESERTPSPADPDLVTRSLDLAASAGLSSPESGDPTRQSYDFSTSQIPSRRGKDSPQQPSFLSAGAGSSSPRKSGGLVQSLRQAMQNRPSFSTFRGSDKEKEKEKRKSGAVGKSNGMDVTDFSSAQIATIGGGNKSQNANKTVLPTPAPTVNLAKIGEAETKDTTSASDHNTDVNKQNGGGGGGGGGGSSTEVSPSQETNVFIAELLNRTYNADDGFSAVNSDVDRLVQHMQQQIDSCRTPTSSSHLDIRKAKDGLVSESRQFVTDSKQLVSSATQSVEKLVMNVNQSMHTLVRITHKCSDTMMCIAAIPQAVTLGSRVKDVAIAYKNTVNAAQQAAGKPLSDPSMKLLMRQATSLAAILSALMKTLKMLEAS